MAMATFAWLTAAAAATPPSFTRGDLSDAAALHAAARAVSSRGLTGVTTREVILVLLDPNFAAWGFNFIQQARRRLGYDNFLIVSLTEADCDQVHAFWARFGERAPPCGWTSRLPLWRTVLAGEPSAQQRLFALYAARWYVSARLLELRVNVLVLDLDGALLRDIYPILRSPPIHRHAVVLTDHGYGSGINCGFVYFNVDAAPYAPEGCARNTSGHRHRRREGTCLSAAVWMAHGVIERILSVAMLRDQSGIQPQAWWEQSVWNDVLRSVELDAAVYPKAWNMLEPRRRSEVFGNYTRSSYADGFLRMRRETEASFRPPLAMRRGAGGVDAGGERLTLMPLCAPRRYRVFSYSGRRECLASGELLVPPSWLVAQGEAPQIGHAGAYPHSTAYAHLVNLWRCFGHDHCFAKHSRLFWLRALGLWDERLDAAGKTPGAQVPWGPLPTSGAAREEVSLASAMAEEASASRDAPRGGTRVLALSASSLAQIRSFLDLHRALHDLTMAAALLGRRPLMPELPCERFRTEGVGSGGERTRHLAGVALPDLLVLRSRADGRAAGGRGARCIPFPGGADCTFSHIMHSFDLPAFERSLPQPPREGIRIPTADLRPHAALPTAAERAAALCLAAAPTSAAPIVHLDGAGVGDNLLLQEANLTARANLEDDDDASLSLVDLRGQREGQRGRLHGACGRGAAQRLAVMRDACPGYLLDTERALRRSLEASSYQRGKAPGAARPARAAQLTLVSAGVGFCAKTAEGAEGDCERGDKGSWGMHMSSQAGALAQRCMRRCLRCSRCRFVSVSLQWGDCSWFAECDVARLQTSVSGFETFARAQVVAGEPTVARSVMRDGGRRGGSVR